MRIKITGVNLVEFIKKVYELSVPQGLGMLHFVDSPLDTKEAEKIVEYFKNNNRTALSLDYLHGRACKMVVFKEGDELTIAPSWYDHTDEQLHQLLKTFNINIPVDGEHGIACNCTDCQTKRG